MRLVVVVLSALSPRVVGIAVVRYDFSSRDTRELSLQEGDMVKIYSKMANGWWRGNVNGRVSAFGFCLGNLNVSPSPSVLAVRSFISFASFLCLFF